MTKNGFSIFLGVIDLLLTEPLSERDRDWYLKALDDLPDSAAHQVGEQCLRMYSRLPKPAQIRKAAEATGINFVQRERLREKSEDELEWERLSPEERERGKTACRVLFRMLQEPGGIERAKALPLEERERLVNEEMARRNGGGPSRESRGGLPRRLFDSPPEVEREPGQEG